MPPALEIRFEGSGVSPDSIFVPDLADVIRAVQRLAIGPLPEEVTPRPLRLPEDKLRLVGVKPGSARYLVAGPAPAVAGAHLRILGDVIENPEGIGENDYILRPVDLLSRIASRLECKISIRDPGRGRAVLARIGPNTYDNISRSVIVSGRTEFAGKVERVGGATHSRCGLRVGFQHRMLICRVPNLELARLLGKHLYKSVVAGGEAAWIRTTWRVYAFRIDSVRPLKRGSAAGMIDVLREAGGSDWDRIHDVRSFLEGEDN